VTELAPLMVALCRRWTGLARCRTGPGKLASGAQLKNAAGIEVRRDALLNVEMRRA
jgi:hypothetical protein